MWLSTDWQTAVELHKARYQLAQLASQFARSLEETGAPTSEVSAALAQALGMHCQGTRELLSCLVCAGGALALGAAGDGEFRFVSCRVKVASASHLRRNPRVPPLPPVLRSLCSLRVLAGHLGSAADARRAPRRCPAGRSPPWPGAAKRSEASNPRQREGERSVCLSSAEPRAAQAARSVDALPMVASWAAP